jgi:hypothetical protein
MRPLVLLALLAALLMGGCSGARVGESWVDPGMSRATVEKVLVVTVARQGTVRKLFEKSFVDGFMEEGVEAIPSHLVIQKEGKPDYDSVLAAVSEVKAGTVLITRLANVVEKTNRSMATGNQYMVLERAPLEPIFFDPNPAFASKTTVKLKLESRLYDVASKKLIWSATSNLKDPVMTRKYIDSVTSGFLGSLRSNDIL